MALPGKGKDLAAFEQDERTCRQYAQTGVAGGQPAATQSNGSAGAGTPGQSPEISYAQCMTAHGNTIQPVPGAANYPAAYPAYGYSPYPYPDGDYWDGLFGWDAVGLYGSCCWGGGYGGYGGRGFGGRGHR